jgi:hypothetical protein
VIYYKCGEMFKNCYRCCLFYFGIGRRNDEVGLNLGLLENGHSVSGNTEHYTVQKISRLVSIRLKLTKINNCVNDIHVLYIYIYIPGA